MAYTVTNPATGEKKRFSTHDEARAAAAEMASASGRPVDDRTGLGASSTGTTATSPAPLPSGGITSTGSLAPETTMRPVARPDRAVTDDGRTVSTWSSDQAPTRAELYPASTADPYVDMTSGEETRAKIMDTAKQFSPLGMVKKGISYLSNVSDSDKIISMVDGEPVYQREDGTTYAYNSLGLPYDTAGPTTLDAVARPETAPIGGSSKKPEEEVVEETTDFTNPCPDGYIFDEEQKICVIDPSVGLAPLPTYELPSTDPTMGGGTSDYTQAMNTFIPTPLQPTQPNTIDQRLAQLEQSLRASQQPSGPAGGGLATTRTGIMGSR